MREVQERSDAIYELLRIPDKIAIDGQLKDVQDSREAVSMVLHHNNSS